MSFILLVSLSLFFMKSGTLWMKSHNAPSGKLNVLYDEAFQLVCVLVMLLLKNSHISPVFLQNQNSLVERLSLLE